MTFLLKAIEELEGLYTEQIRCIQRTSFRFGNLENRQKEIKKELKEVKEGLGEIKGQLKDILAVIDWDFSKTSKEPSSDTGLDVFPKKEEAWNGTYPVEMREHCVWLYKVKQLKYKEIVACMEKFPVSGHTPHFTTIVDWIFGWWAVKGGYRHKPVRAKYHSEYHLTDEEIEEAKSRVSNTTLDGTRPSYSRLWKGCLVWFYEDLLKKGWTEKMAKGQTLKVFSRPDGSSPSESSWNRWVVKGGVKSKNHPELLKELTDAYNHKEA